MNSEERKQYMIEYRLKNKDKLFKKYKEYRQKNREKLKQASKEYNQKNREKLKQANKEYNQKNREKLKQAKKEYRQKNKEKCNQSHKKYRQTLIGKYSTYKSSAKRRNKLFDLSYAQFISIMDLNCSYCDMEKCNGIDRVDNNIGYLIENCVPCCSNCNFMKNALSKEEFINHIIKIYNNIKSKL